MKNILLFIALLYAVFPCTAQNRNDFLAAAQVGSNTLSTHSYDVSILLGMKTPDGDQFLLGPQIKRFNTAIGHQQTYWGARVHAQANVIGLAPFLNVGFLQGEYYTYQSDILPPTIKQDMQLHGTFGVGYMFHPAAGIFVGYSVQEYNPGKYYNQGTSPYKDGAFSIKLSLNAPFGNGFTTGSVGQRRMW